MDNTEQTQVTFPVKSINQNATRIFVLVFRIPPIIKIKKERSIEKSLSHIFHDKFRVTPYAENA